MHRLSKAQARRMAVRGQLLDAPRPSELLAVVQQLTLLQLDPTAAARGRGSPEERQEASQALQEPWPLEAWPDTPTRYLVCRADRMFPAAWARRHARERLGVDADEMDGGHYIALSRPRELAEQLAAYVDESSVSQANTEP